MGWMKKIPWDEDDDICFKAAVALLEYHGYHPLEDLQEMFYVEFGISIAICQNVDNDIVIAMIDVSEDNKFTQPKEMFSINNCTHITRGYLRVHNISTKKCKIRYDYMSIVKINDSQVFIRHTKDPFLIGRV